MVMSWIDGHVEAGIKEPSFQTFKTFSDRYSHKYVSRKVQNKKGQMEDKTEPLGLAWLKWPGRSTFEGVGLHPGAGQELPGRRLNLWQGFGVEPKANVAGCGWPLMKRHILEVLAAGDRLGAWYIVRWAAWAVQHPDRQAGAALVLRGGKGSGKGTFAHALRRIFGQHGLHIANSAHLTGRFNAHLAQCLLLYADEAFWAGDKQGESVLKTLITEPTLMIEPKGLNPEQWVNRIHLIMTANAEWVVPASHDERRFAVFEVSEEKRHDKKYWDGLHTELNAGGHEAMLYDLLKLDLGDWHPRMIPDSAALRRQKIESMSELDAWLERLLQDGHLPFHYGALAHEALASAMMDHYQRGAGPRGQVSSYAIAKYLKRAGCTSRHVDKGTMWHFLPLKEMRSRWVRKWGEWSWAVSANDWIERNSLEKMESLSVYQQSISP
jgi:hypothetical protein